MKDLIQDAINDQIRAEFDSAYTYLAMAATMESKNLKGFGNWLRVQWQEEIGHAMRLYDFLLHRGGKVELKSLSQPSYDSTEPLVIFDQVLAMEKENTARIHQLYDLALTEKDYALQTILHWFIDEQVEEEDIADDIIEKLKLIGDSGPNLFLLDQEMGQRSAESEA
jgi:ferritin